MADAIRVPTLILGVFSEDEMTIGCNFCAAMQTVHRARGWFARSLLRL
jgi:hypothetical protein